MQLITMAHYGEAQAFIEKWNLEKVSEDLFKSDHTWLLLTGEGPFEAATKTALNISKVAFDKVVNLGFAGGLNPKLARGDFYTVRTIYLFLKDHLEFKTFQSAENGVDCLTTFERIISADKAAPLQGLGHLVDREAWGVAMAAKMARLPFECYKIVSDIAGSLESCQFTRDSAEELSHKLFNSFCSLMPDLEPKPITKFPEGFYFTSTTGHRYQNLIHRLSIKKNIIEKEILNQSFLLELAQKEVSPKERTKALLEFLEEELDPHRKLLKEKISHMQKEFQKVGAKIVIDPLWENPKATISFEAGDDQELQSQLEALKSVSLKELAFAMKGQFNVE
jgi:hypothetical protein